MHHYCVFLRENDDLDHDSQAEDNSGGQTVSSESEEDDGKDDSEVEEEFVAENASSKISNRSSPSVLSKSHFSNAKLFVIFRVDVSEIWGSFIGEIC